MRARICAAVVVGGCGPQTSPCPAFAPGEEQSFGGIVFTLSSSRDGQLPHPIITFDLRAASLSDEGVYLEGVAGAVLTTSSGTDHVCNVEIGDINVPPHAQLLDTYGVPIECVVGEVRITHSCEAYGPYREDL